MSIKSKKRKKDRKVSLDIEKLHDVELEREMVHEFKQTMDSNPSKNLSSF